jgi:hypothetical protein
MAVNVAVGVLDADRLVKLTLEGRIRTAEGPTRMEMFAVEIWVVVELLPIIR